MFSKPALLAIALGVSAPDWVLAGVAIDSFPPVVVRTYPAAGEQNVDSRLSEVRVTFNKDMMTHEMWSFVYAKPASFPKISGEIRYLPDGTTYGMWINSPQHNSFKDTRRNSAVPYLLVFSTRD